MVEKSERFECDGKVYWSATEADRIILKDRIDAARPGMVWYYPWWKPKNFWRNHFAQSSATLHSAWETIHAEDSMDESLLDCAIARLEEDMGWNGSTG